MEDTRVTFETAKLAKGKGFPQETNRLEIPYYNCKGEFKGDVSDWRVRKYIRGEDTSDVESVSAPTQSLLAKWLRKEHNLHINICSLSMNCFSFMLEKLNDTGTTLCGGHLGKINYKTYEEAYEIGLQEALKLI
jgi:hypothetical protein